MTKLKNTIRKEQVIRRMRNNEHHMINIYKHLSKIESEKIIQNIFKDYKPLIRDYFSERCDRFINIYQLTKDEIGISVEYLSPSSNAEHNVVNKLEIMVMMI